VKNISEGRTITAEDICVTADYMSGKRAFIGMNGL
jgi:hypothetical protein